MVDPDIGDGGYLDYSDPDWDAVLAQVSCIWSSDPTSDDLRAAAHYFQIYDDAREGIAVFIENAAENRAAGSIV